MEQLWPYIALVLVLVLVYIAGGMGAETTQTAFEGYFRGFRPDPWPHGVQEEDIDHHWGANTDRTRSDERGESPRGGGSPRRGSSPAVEVAELSPADARGVATRPVRGFRVQAHS